MNTKIISNGILRALGILVGIAFFLFFLYTIQSVIIYVIIAGILSLITPSIKRQELDPVPRMHAIPESFIKSALEAAKRSSLMNILVRE